MTILIIKLSALGDFIFATPAFKALSNHYKGQRIVLLTTPPYRDFAQKLGYFDDIIAEIRPKWYQFAQLKSIIKKLRGEKWEKVYDLQGVQRTKLYSYCVPSSTKWLTIASSKEISHIQDRIALLLSKDSINFSPELDLNYIAENYPLNITKPYVLLIPGSSAAHQGKKRWPENSYANLAKSLESKGITSVVIGGGESDFPLIRSISPNTINLAGKTSWYQIIGLAQKAAMVIGNDTGPSLLAASSGCKSLIFYSKFNPSTIAGLRERQNFSLQCDDLGQLEWQLIERKVLNILEY